MDRLELIGIRVRDVSEPVSRQRGILQDRASYLPGATSTTLGSDPWTDWRRLFARRHGCTRWEPMGGYRAAGCGGDDSRTGGFLRWSASACDRGGFDVSSSEMCTDGDPALRCRAGYGRSPRSPDRSR